MIPGRCRAGWRTIVANLLCFLLLAVGTQILARESLQHDLSLWPLPWTRDVVLVLAALLFLGMGFLMPLHAGVVNLGIYAELLAGFAAAAALIAQPVTADTGALAFFTLLGGAIAGAIVGAILIWLKSRFAVHEILSGLLLGGAMLAFLPSGTPSLELGPNALLTGGILVLALGILITLAFAHFLRASAPGFDLRIVGSNPLAAVAAGVDVDRVQLWTLLMGGACAGLTGALQIWAESPVAIERWPLPLAFAGITVAVYAVGSARGLLAVSILFALLMNMPGTLVALGSPIWGTVAVSLLVLPALWTLPRLLPDQGAPRALWRTRHRETY